MLAKRMAYASLFAALVAAVVALGLPDEARAHEWNIVTVESAGDVGIWTDIVVDGTGRVMVAYDEQAYLDLKFAICDPSLPAGCDDTGDWDTVKVDDSGDVWGYTSIALDPNGDPMISYRDQTNDHLKFAWCDISASVHLNCDDPSDWATMTVDDGGVGGDAVGRWSSIAVSTLSWDPWISYYDETNGDLKAAVCKDWSAIVPCNETTKPWTILTLDDGGGSDVGEYTSNGEAAGRRPIISYVDDTSGHLKFAICLNPVGTECDHESEWTTGVTVDSAGSVRSSSITADASGNPMISYEDYTNDNLKFARCDTVASTGCDQTGDWTTKVAVDTEGVVGMWTSIAAKANGDPVISYYDATNDAVKFAWCDDLAGTGCDDPDIDWSREVVDSSVVSGYYTSIAMRWDDVWISYEGSLDVATGRACETWLNEDASQGSNSIVVEPGDAALCPIGHRILINEGEMNEECHTIIGQGPSDELYLADTLAYDHSHEGGETVDEVASCSEASPFWTGGTLSMPLAVRFSNIALDLDDDKVLDTDAGPATFTGYVTVEHGDSYRDGQNRWVTEAEMVSMDLNAIVWGESVSMTLGQPSSGEFREQMPDAGFPADSFFDVFFEVDSLTLGLLENCDDTPARFTGEVYTAPVRGDLYYADDARILACQKVVPPLGNGGAGPRSPGFVRAGGDDGEGQPSGPVGGTAEYPDVAAGAESAVDSPSGSGFNYTVLAAALGAVAAALAAGAWFARRRWLT